MNAILARLKNNPVLLGTVVSVAGTFGVTVPTGSGWLGLALAVGEFVVALVVRSKVSPVAAPVAAPGAVAPSSPVVPHG